MKSILRKYAKDIQTLQIFFDFLIINLIYLFLYINIDNLSKIDTYILIIFLYPILINSGLYKSYRFKKFTNLYIRILLTSFFIFSYFYLMPFILPNLNFVNLKSMYKFLFPLFCSLSLTNIGFRYYLRFLRSKGRNLRNYLFWGNHASLCSITREINNNQYLGYNLYAWFSPDDYDSNKLGKEKIRFKGGIKELEKWLSKNEDNIDCIFFDHISNGGFDINKVLEIFGNTSLPVVFSPSWSSSKMKFNYSNFGEQAFLELWGNDQEYYQQKIKQFMDFICSLILIIIFSPILILISLILKFSNDGAIIYSQDRYGIYGKKFKIYKFRTMIFADTGYEKELVQTTKNDKRVTRFGSFLRKWSLDELPQLFNVIKGDMSLVGPRPHAVSHNEKYRKLILGYMQRHSIKPGISGFAQVNGYRGETKTLEEMESRIAADLYYQKNWSLRMDLKVLIKTVLNIRSKKAY